MFFRWSKIDKAPDVPLPLAMIVGANRNHRSCISVVSFLRGESPTGERQHGSGQTLCEEVGRYSMSFTDVSRFTDDILAYVGGIHPPSPSYLRM